MPHDAPFRLPDYDASLGQFAVGQPVPRTEDPKLLRGEGRYADDVNVDGQAYAVIVRSQMPHGVIRGVDLEAARAMPGVLGAWSGKDLAGYGPLKCRLPHKNRDGSPIRNASRPVLAVDKVSYVGDPVAFVVAETPYAAQDAAEAVMLDIDALPAITTIEEAIAPDAPVLFEAAPGNVALDFHYGDADKVAAAFASAHHVTRLSLVNSRVVINSLEPRSAVAAYDASREHFTLWLGCQGVFGLRQVLATEFLNIAPDKLRILTQQVGGSFGMKAGAYPEYICLFHAARELGRAVKWTDKRSESFLSDHQGRDSMVEAELALDRDGRFVAVRATGYANMGAYITHVGPLMYTVNLVKNIVSVYRTPLVEAATKALFTNMVPIGPYRGAGRPESNYFMERLIDQAARETGLDKVELRRRNHIVPTQMPYSAPSGMVYDSGDFTAVLDKALGAADWAGFPARKAEAAERGQLRGIGIGQFLEVTAPPSAEMGGLRFEADGTVTLITGTLDYGQGHATSFAQVLSERLGIPFDRIRLLQGDSDELIAGGGTGGSRSIMSSGAAIVKAGDRVIEKGRQIAATLLEAGIEDIEFTGGHFRVVGTDRGVSLMDLAQRLRAGIALPPGMPTSLDVRETIDGVPSAFPNGCHIAEVEVDPDTGVTAVVDYTIVSDTGTVINPLLVEGQLHGGVVQGIGQVLMERVVYDNGQPLTGSFMDYAMPRASDVPFMSFLSHPVPATTNPLGAKGCGEAGCAGAMSAVMNALVDALSVRGITHIDMPATPLKVWEALHQQA